MKMNKIYFTLMLLLIILSTSVLSVTEILRPNANGDENDGVPVGDPRVDLVLGWLFPRKDRVLVAACRRVGGQVGAHRRVEGENVVHHDSCSCV